MIISVTGDERDIANSAWVSTINEIKAQEKSYEEVVRVVKFLVEHHHTSPFESVTISMYLDENESVEGAEYYLYATDKYAVCSHATITMDLLNFTKVTYRHNLWSSPAWTKFSEVRPALASLVSGFKDIQDSPVDDVTPLLGDDHGMSVELIHLHESKNDQHSRATWRIKCPLSIAVQILRHRTGSYNMVSGRYRTISQDQYGLPDDVLSTLNDANLKDEALLLFNDKISDIIYDYENLMKKLKTAQKDGIITNDAYKRARECVRFVLPEGRMTELYVTYYLSDFYGNYKMLRDSVHAQTEHIWIAQQCDRTIKRFRENN